MKRKHTCGRGNSGAAGRTKINTAIICPHSSKPEQWCKCGDERCGKGFCKPHGMNKYKCKREGCRGNQICEHDRNKYDCNKGNCVRSSRCRHGNLRPSRCATCLEELCKPCEGESMGESPPKTPVAPGPKRVVLRTFVFAELLLSRATPELA